ncbi:helix-turn-helix transcriptional regulator [Celeribacter indicus]|uniref:Prophage CP4-57 regulatory n=1 Tax=Celeribacter indicus TaxID=1208324 RepID=A0A0B5E2D3_9RHOB|nr:helix-turn-helix domain-containing protein [Celeribacter indicus]AJE47171.1 prophage CP4-57 regulatory [Celeribacter indicus]SDW00064.1 Prophage CP4-57 regulatory protein (AlpA) [Celeribacter indicus]
MNAMIPQPAPDAQPLVPDKRIPAAVVRTLCGGVSNMTIHRWLNRDDFNFPKPIRIGNRRYWKEADIIAWLEAQEG